MAQQPDPLQTVFQAPGYFDQPIEKQVQSVFGALGPQYASMPDQDKQQVVKRLNERMRAKMQGQASSAVPSPYLGMFQPSPQMEEEWKSQQEMRNAQAKLETEEANWEKARAAASERASDREERWQQDYDEALKQYEDAAKQLREAKTPDDNVHATKLLDMARDRLSIASSALSNKLYKPPTERAGAYHLPSPNVQPIFYQYDVDPNTPWDQIDPEKRRLISDAIAAKESLMKRNAQSLINARGAAHGIGQPGWTIAQSRYFDGRTKDLFTQYAANNAKIRTLSSIYAGGDAGENQNEINKLRSTNIQILSDIEKARQDTDLMGHTVVPPHKMTMFGPRGTFTLDPARYRTPEEFQNAVQQMQVNGYHEVPGQ